MRDEDDDDFDDSDDAVYPRCRSCGTELFDDETVRCPSCGNYQSREDAPPTRHPGWIIFTAILLVFMSLYWIVKH